MTRTCLAIAASCCALALGGCSADAEPEVSDSQAPDFVAKVAEVARVIAQHPEAADSILAAHEMTRGRLDSLMFEIAMDPDLTEAFEAARR